MTAVAPISMAMDQVGEAPVAEPIATEAAEPIATSPEDRVELQRLWLAVVRHPWKSLALVPIGGAVSTPRLAAALAALAAQHLGAAVAVIDATSVSLGTLQREIGAVAASKERGERVLVALPALAANPSGVALAQATDAAVVFLALGSSAVAEADRILDEVGRDRVLGSVIVTERKDKP